MYTVKLFLLINALVLFNKLSAQNYQAVNGSSYAGSLSPSNNPASIVQVPYTWDITPFAVQLKQATNAFVISNYSLLSTPSNAKFITQSGTIKRFEFTNQNIRLLNTRINLNSKSAIAFGANIRSYVYATTSQANWQDSTRSLYDFMKINTSHLPLSGESRGSAWAELYATYAHIIIDDGKRILTAGLTLKVDRALAGGYINAGGLSYIPATGSEAGYLLTEGRLQYGYSSNFDEIDSNKTSSANRKSFYQHSMSGISADAGLEYILLDDNDDKDENNFAYRTKIGISLMDIGKNKFRYSSRSSSVIAGKPNISDTLIERRFLNIHSIDGFNDSLAGIANSFTQLNGAFNMYQPARIIINVDQHLLTNFFLNAELTLAVLSLVPKKILYIKDMNLLAITPRWETKLLGVYFPVQLNTQKQLWVGGAFKAGPVLFGTHNIANIFSKNKMQAGGFYFAFTIRPGKNNDRQGGQSSERISGKTKRSLQCPKF
ncbi:hypothetical protein [Ferruginibacter sp.]|uniref:hypothetical protein n=1 Tax=Ferruginibacter sp. TaxID=1940288 RepID=UPI00374D4042